MDLEHVGDNLYRLRVFVEVADRLSFSAAAQRLYMTQPSVSAHIKRLELAVGHPLFRDRKSRLALTEAGQVVERYARQLLATTTELSAALAALDETVSGRISLGATLAWESWLPDLLGAFQLSHPQVTPALTFGAHSQVLDFLLDKRVDLGFFNEPISDPRFASASLGQDVSSLVVVAAPGHPLAQLKYVEPHRLDPFPVVLLDTLKRPGVLDRLLSLGVRPQKIIEIGSIEGIKRLVSSGAGISVFLDSMLQYDRRPDIVAIPLVAPPMVRPLVAAWLSGRALTSVEKALLDSTSRSFRAERSA